MENKGNAPRVRRDTLIVVGFLILITAIFFLVAVIVKGKCNETAFNILVGLGSSCGAVLVLALVHLVNKGEPLQGYVAQRMDQLVSSMDSLDNSVKDIPTNIGSSQNTLCESLQTETNKIVKKIDELEQERTIVESGIQAVFHERRLSHDNEFWREEFLNSKELRDFDVIGISLRDMVHSFHNDIDKWEERIKQGSDIRILILKLDGIERKRRIEHENKDVSWFMNIEDLPILKKNIKEILEATKDAKGSFKFGFYDIIPYCNIVRVGEKMLVTNYLYKLTGFISPTYLIEKTKDKQLFGKYMEHFENVWESGKVEIYKLNDSGEVELASV